MAFSTSLGYHSSCLEAEGNESDGEAHWLVKTGNLGGGHSTARDGCVCARENPLYLCRLHLRTPRHSSTPVTQRYGKRRAIHCTPRHTERLGRARRLWRVCIWGVEVVATRCRRANVPAREESGVNGPIHRTATLKFAFPHPLPVSYNSPNR